jgi:glucuronosyltransferase
LPENLELFVSDPRSKGTIFIAFGTNVLWKFAPRRILDSFVGTLNTLREYRIIFVFNGEKIPQFADHVMVLRWSPQFDILSHPKTVLFISHGGLKRSFIVLTASFQLKEKGHKVLR